MISHDSARYPRHAVEAVMNLDRRTAGWSWCRQVEECLRGGWQLFSHYWGISGMASARRQGAARVLERFESLQEDFEYRYKSVL
jgi:hypothetical protein